MKNMKFGKLLLGVSALLAGALVGCNPVEPATETINSRVMMRSCGVNGNEWTILPSYLPESQVKRVMTLIGNGEATEAAFPAGCTEYIIQHVDGAHHMYSYVDWNGAKHDNIDGTASQEFFQVQELNGSWQHVYNFNAGKCDNAATHNAALMDNGFQGAKTLNEYASNTIQAWKIFLIDGQYYLGIDFSAKKGDGEIEADGIYDDWVVRIIPINGSTVDPENPDPVDPDPVDPDPDPEDPTDDPETVQGAHVEFDVHQQEHKDWKEIKTSIHLRDTVDFTILLPVPEAYQAESDDFDLRLGEKYEYLAHEITLVDKTYQIVFSVTHKAEGIEIFVKGNTPECAQALRVARALYGDGLTFEVHTYVKNEVEGVPVGDDLVWSWLKQIEKPTASPETNVFGQVTSAFFPEDGIRFAPQED